MSLRTKLESAVDPTEIKATEESYISAIEALGKYFLRALDSWPDFDKEKDWSESELGNALYDRCEKEIPEFIKQELSWNQVGMAAHVAYQAFIQS